MDAIFAPWRMQWVERDRPEGEGKEGGGDGDGDRDGGAGACIFCALPERGDDRGALVVARSDRVYVLLNNSPYNPGHSMIVPYEHTGEYRALDEAALLDLMTTAQRIVGALDRSLSPSGFNIGFNIGAAGGASVAGHLHMHVIPRWESDTNFMPLTANTAVVEEAIDETYQRLQDALRADGAATSEDQGGALRLADLDE